MLLPNRDAKKHKLRSAMVSVGVHVFLLGIFVIAYGVDKIRDEVPRLIKLKLGSSSGSNGLSFSSAEAAQKNYPKDIAIDFKEGDDLADFIDENLGLVEQKPAQEPEKMEVKKLADTSQDLSSPEKIEQKVEEIQKAQVKRKNKAEKEKAEIAELETASGKGQAGSPIGNAKEGKTSLSYLELLQYTLQENSAIPHLARQQGLQGDAILRLTFDRNGYVQDFALVSKTGHDLLDEAALKLAQKLMQKPLPPMPKNFEKGSDSATYDFPISFRP